MTVDFLIKEKTCRFCLFTRQYVLVRANGSLLENLLKFGSAVNVSVVEATTETAKVVISKSMPV